ncbi:MAG: hypothetical protein ACPKM0_05380 [Pleomorphochaeta sp.]
MKRKLYLLLITINILLVVLISCDFSMTSNTENENNQENTNNSTSENNEDDDSVYKNLNIKGNFPTAVSRAISPTLSTDYTLWLLPIYSDYNFSISPDIFYDKSEFEVNDDGSFSVNINNNYDKYIILVMDLSQDDKIKQIVGYISLDGLIMFPIDEINENLDLGTMEAIEDEVNSETSLEDVASSFSYNINELEVISEMDDSLKIIKNHYINLDTHNFSKSSYNLKGNLNKVVNGDDTYTYSIDSYGLDFITHSYLNNSGDATLESSDGNTEYELGSCYPNSSSVKYYKSFNDNNILSPGIWKLKDNTGKTKGQYIYSLYKLKNDDDEFIVPLPYITFVIENDLLTEIDFNWKEAGESISGEIANEFINRDTFWIQSNVIDGTYCSGRTTEITINDEFTKIILNSPLNIDDIDNLQFGFNSSLGSFELLYY